MKMHFSSVGKFEYSNYHVKPFVRLFNGTRNRVFQLFTAMEGENSFLEKLGSYV